MPRVEGRGIKKPTIAESYVGDQLVIRIDDKKNPITWMMLAFTPEEFGELFDRYAAHLVTTGQADAAHKLLHQSTGGVGG